MIIKQLQLTNFRSYKKYNIDFSPITVFVGPNGVGKSNILEALTLLAYGKSYRTRHEKNLINYGKNYAQIVAKLSDEKHINFVISEQDQKIVKEVSINKIRCKLSKLLGIIKLVIFTPESLKIITDSPGQRRKFLDICLSQINRNYLDNLISLRQIIKQRNELLKTIANHKSKAKELDFWNNKLIQSSQIIYAKRKTFIDYLGKYLSDYYRQISGNVDTVKINYDSKCDRIEEYINISLEKELMAQKTLFGPHLDDFMIKLNHKPLADTGSRGEIRSIALCLKLLEIKYLKDHSKADASKEVILLLDDIYSELDEKRRSQIAKIIKDQQTVITTTDESFVDKIDSKVKIINL